MHYPIADDFASSRVSRSTDGLVASFHHLCKRGAHKFWRSGLERNDLEQVAAIGLIKAARRYDPTMPTPFEAYAWLMIVGELMHHVRDRRGDPAALRLRPRDRRPALSRTGAIRLEGRPRSRAAGRMAAVWCSGGGCRPRRSAMSDARSQRCRFARPIDRVGPRCSVGAEASNREVQHSPFALIERCASGAIPSMDVRHLLKSCEQITNRRGKASSPRSDGLGTQARAETSWKDGPSGRLSICNL